MLWSGDAGNGQGYCTVLARSESGEIDGPWEKCKNEMHWHKAADGSCLWKGDTSSDELSGHFFALPIYYDLCADRTERQGFSRRGS